MNRATGLRLLAAALLWGVACGPSDPVAEPQGGSEPAEVDAPSAPPPSPAPDPAPAPPEPSPDVASERTWECLPGSAEAGAELYATLCESCHGPGGNGEGPAAAGLNPKPARHTDGGYMNALSTEHIRTVIRDGGPAVGKSPLMAPWGASLSDAQLDDMVAYVRSLAQPPYACP